MALLHFNMWYNLCYRMPTVHLIQNTNKTVTVVRLLVIALHVCTTVIVLLLIPQIYSKISQASSYNYRPPEGGRLYDMKVVRGYAFLRTYYVLKKLTANHAAAISHKHWCEATLEKLDCLRKGGDSRVWLHVTQLSSDMKESRFFMYILNNSDILFRFG